MKDLQKIPNHFMFMENQYRNLISASNCSDFYFAMEGNKIGDVTAITFPDEVWEHVLLDPLTLQRCPTWPEMVRMKEMFWNPRDVVIQVHPAKKDYINIMPYALHQWRHRFFRYDLSHVFETTKQLLENTSTEPHYITDISHGQRFIAIYGGNNWPSWENVCDIKQKCFGPDCPAIQYNLSKEFDLNSKFLLTVWDASNLPLPPRELV